MDVAAAVRAYLDRMIQQVSGVTILLLDNETVNTYVYRRQIACEVN